jgi:hypothetical protein
MKAPKKTIWPIACCAGLKIEEETFAYTPKKNLTADRINVRFILKSE